MQHNLVTASIYFENAFVQSSLPEPISVNLPTGYGKDHSDKVLEVNKSLYGDHRAPRLWYDYLKARLETLGLTLPCASAATVNNDKTHLIVQNAL